MCPYLAKGIGLIFTNPSTELPSDSSAATQKKQGDVGAGPGKSSLFFVRDGHPGNAYLFILTITRISKVRRPELSIELHFIGKCH